METLSKWAARRSGDGITITHLTGKVKVATIEPQGDRIVAIKADGTTFALAPNEGEIAVKMDPKAKRTGHYNHRDTML